MAKLENELKDGGRILLVTHGDIGQMIYAAYYNLDWKDVLQLFHLITLTFCCYHLIPKQKIVMFLKRRLLLHEFKSWE